VSAPPGPSPAVDRFLRRQAAVPEPAMRRALWHEFFESAAPEEVLEAVSRTLAGMAGRESWARLAYQALLDLIDAVRGREYPPRRALYEAARLAEREDVCRLLLMAPRAREATPAELRNDITVGDRELTLGERRALARTRDRAMLLRLLGDPDPGVVANVLANPFLTEPDVVRLASRRPIAGESLRAVFRHARWGRAPEVLRALIYNPYTPTDIALGLLPLLEAPLLRAVSRETSIAPVVRERARALVRGPAGDEPLRDP
jgi:hypothetical protein